MDRLQKYTGNRRYRVLSGSALKLLAVAAMAVDHCALILWQQDPAMNAALFYLGSTGVSVYRLLRKVGRLAFPIFCFLVAQGYRHTRSRKKYCLSLGLFALVSELPFDLMVSGSLLYPGKQNVFFTLLLGALLLSVYEAPLEQRWKALGYGCLAALAILLRGDYGLAGAVLVAVMYALDDRPALRALVAYPMLSGGVAALGAFLPISLYNGKRGFIRGPWLKYAFYLFYPGHILALWALKTFILT